MKKLFFLAALCATTLFIACEQTEVITDTDIQSINLENRAAGMYTLYAGQDIEAGTVSIEVVGEDLVVTYQTNECWSAGTTHLYVGTAEDVPVNGAGNPKHGKFPYAQEVEEDTLGNPVELLDMVVYTIPLSEVEVTEMEMEGGSSVVSCVYIAAHAELYNDCLGTGEETEGDAEETGYAAWDIEFDGNRWGGLIEYCM